MYDLPKSKTTGYIHVALIIDLIPSRLYTELVGVQLLLLEVAQFTPRHTML